MGIGGCVLTPETAMMTNAIPIKIPIFPMRSGAGIYNDELCHVGNFCLYI